MRGCPGVASRRISGGRPALFVPLVAVAAGPLGCWDSCRSRRAAGAAHMPIASRAFRWGQLRDSDPFVGSSSGVRQPNVCVAFEMDVPAP
jgi:hypothetical protein